MNRTRGRGRRNPPNRFAFTQLHREVKQISSQVHGQGVKRIRKNAQIISVPSHSYQLKIRKTFRIAVRAVISPIPIGTVGLTNHIVQELGFEPKAASGMTTTLHGFKFYATNSNNEFVNLTTQVLDIEESAGTANQRTIALFEDFSSHAGVAHIAGIFPVNNRPTWNSNATNVDIFHVQSNIDGLMVLDFDMTVMRTSTTVPGLLTNAASSSATVAENDTPTP